MYSKLLLLAIVTLYIGEVNAQVEIWNKKRISSNLVENFVVSADNKKIKNGEYFVVTDNKKELVRGKFKLDKKDSTWTFFNENGDIIQVYNYRTNKLIFNSKDEISKVKERFEIDSALATNKKVVSPKKIGGVNYGFYLLYNERTLPIQVKQQQNNVLMEYVFSLSATGKLEDWHVVYTSRFYNDDIKMSIHGLPADAYEFIAASVDGQPVKSKLVYQIPLNVNQARDKGTYNVPTQQN